MSFGPALVVGLGSRTGGDDAVGFEVVRAIRRERSQVDAVEASDASALVELARGEGTLVVVDAAVGLGPAGDVREIDERTLGRATAVSSHALGAADALRLARALHGDAACRRIRVVAVAIDRPRGVTEGLGGRVRAAVPVAARLAVALALAPRDDAGGPPA